MDAIKVRFKSLYTHPAVYLVIFLSLVPMFLPSPYWLHVMIMAGLYSILAVSWDLLAGYCGQISFGHAGFYGIGAYVSALSALSGISPWLSLLLGSLTAMTIGVLIALPCARLRGPYLAVATIGFGEITYLILLNWVEVTRGSLGLGGIPPFPGVPYTKVFYYYIMLSFFSLTLFITYKIVSSNIGLRFRAIRDDELLASVMGINTLLYKVLAFAISSFFAGLAGGFSGHFITVIAPETAHISVTASVVAMAVIGGRGTLFGPAVAAFGLMIAPELLREISPYLRVFLIGLLLIVVMKFAPEGIVPRLYPIYKSYRSQLPK